jgi:hypothetical protein
MKKKHREVWIEQLDPLFRRNQVKATHIQWQEMMDICARAVRTYEEELKKSKLVKVYARKRNDGEEGQLRQNVMSVLAVVMSGLPFNVLSNNYFCAQQAVRAGCECVARGLDACSRCKGPSRDLARSILEDIECAITLHIRELLQDVDAVSITVDGWSDIQRRKIIGVTAHWYAEPDSQQRGLNCY